MQAAIAEIKREDLLREIFNALSHWSELERRVFARVHYQGQSLEAVARSASLTVEEVSLILTQCERRLYASLREFHQGGGRNPAIIPAKTAGSAARKPDLKKASALASGEKGVCTTSAIAV